jgi:hypothetical protein
MKASTVLLLALGAILTACGDTPFSEPTNRASDEIIIGGITNPTGTVFNPCVLHPGLCMAPESACVQYAPTGDIQKRWTLTGGQGGPMGCPTGAPFAVQASQFQSFAGGQIGTAAGAVGALSVAAYQLGADLVVDFGGIQSASYNFTMQWTVNGGPTQTRQVPDGANGDGTRGVWFLPQPVAGTYVITIGGCTVGGRNCTNSLFPPVSVTFVPPPPPLPSTCAIPATGPIGDRWLALGGPSGSLGCPTSAQTTLPNGEVQTFARGQMAHSPNQGSDMVVALYQSGQKIYLDASTSAPYSYDKFIVLESDSGAQFDSTHTDGSKLSSILTPIDPFAPGWPTQPVYVSGQRYTISIEGCDVDPITMSSTCHQSWTLPVSTTFNPGYPSVPSPTTLDFSRLNPVTDARYVNDQLSPRGQAAAAAVACTKVLGSATGDEEDWGYGAIAKLDMIRHADPTCWLPVADFRTEVNNSIMAQKIGSKVGSTSDTAPCVRTGEYDVELSALIRLVDGFPDLVNPEAREHIINDLLNQSGKYDPTQTSWSCVGSDVPETENHLNMIESARYLTNQIRYARTGDPTYDNEANGMNQYWLNRLQGFLANDFFEYNSKPYQYYTDFAIQNLFDFAKDRRVKAGAQLALDYIGAKFAVSSNALRRDAPFRRRVSHYDPNILSGNVDEQSARFAFLSGAFQIFGDPAYSAPGMQGPWKPGDQFDASMILSDVSTYRAPPDVLDLIINPQHRTFYQRIKHATVETYASRPDYLITGGGFWTGAQAIAPTGAGSDDQGPAVPITLMPTNEFISDEDMIRFEIQDGYDVHTCVAPDFACGLNLTIPALYESPQTKGRCWWTEAGNGGTWTFIDFSTPSCQTVTNAASVSYPSSSYGFYVAAWELDENVARSPSKGGVFGGGPALSALNYGFFEVHPRDANLSFWDFTQGVKSRNAGATFTAAGQNTYAMTSGAVLKFNMPLSTLLSNEWQWPFATMGDATLDGLGTDMSAWPLASGDVLNSEGHTGKVSFYNPSTSNLVTMDFSDHGEPAETTLHVYVSNPRGGLGR